MANHPWLTIIGLGEDGPDSPGPASRKARAAAGIVIGARRHPVSLPDTDAGAGVATHEQVARPAPPHRPSPHPERPLYIDQAGRDGLAADAPICRGLPEDQKGLRHG